MTIARAPHGAQSVRMAVLAVCAGMIGSPVWGADGDPRFCPNRPSLGASACTTEPGQAQIEMSGLDWERDKRAGEQRDTFLMGDTIARFGIFAQTELQLAWTPYGIERTRDAVGAISHERGVGDVTVALRQNFKNPDGKSLSFGVQPFVTLPVGRQPIGEGDWSAGVIVPITYDLSDDLNLQFTGEVDAAADDDGDGRHLAYSGIIGLSRELGDQVTANGEFMLEQDDDPGGHQTRAFAGVSMAFHPAKTWQIDVLGVAGLNRDAPDFRLVVGGAILLR